MFKIYENIKKKNILEDFDDDLNSDFEFLN